MSVEERSIPKQKSCSTVTKYVPVVGWLPQYTRLQAVSDLIAGITLGLTMIPQSMAYAALAGLTAQYGLYSCFVGGFVYVFFGTIREVSIGPSSLMALITLQYTRDMPVDFVVLLCFLAGCVEFLMGVLHLGFIVDFISMPVTSSFISATSVIIIIAQLQGLLGLKYKSANIVDNIYKMFKNISQIRPTDLTLGICSIIFLLFFRKMKDIDCFSKNEKNLSRNSTIKKILWYFSIGRNALIVFITTTIAYHFETTGSAPFRLSGKIESGLPAISLPPFSSQVGNQTYTFLDMCTYYGSGIVILPLISVLANVAIAKAFATDAVNATQEMLTLGLCNILGSFVSAMPSTGAFTRSAVSSASGIQTPMAATMTLLALSFLTPYFYYIPRATLSAVLICAVMFMIDFKIIKLLWKGCKTDAFAAIVTFLVCVLVSVEIGLLLGAILNLIFFIRPSARPEIHVANCKTHLGNGYIMLKPDTCLYYPAVAHFCDKVMNVARTEQNDVPLIVNCERFTNLDYTSIKTIEMLSRRLNAKGNRFWLFNLNPEIVESIAALADNKYIRLIENENSIADFLYDNTPTKEFEEFTSRKKSREARKDALYSNSLQADSESNAEEMALVISSETKTRQ
ncbi:sodium-independent sulfate anion transporter-like isoform X2 [Pseudomyrmex gracilis]|uniref:sodium-independent sulfate anion transporter-like isoform X2 n=1 Tax=Pseudomyrmex gracilis TaxID=219809 RepID=UPI000995B568|nr:sodium-independent sulfate anion transporter-like isoform X2 [Pseudomyrmex gracilis]